MEETIYADLIDYIFEELLGEGVAMDRSLIDLVLQLQSEYLVDVLGM